MATPKRNSKGKFVKKSSGGSHHKSSPKKSSGSHHKSSPKKSGPKSGRRRRRSSMKLGTGAIVGIAAGAMGAGLLGAYLLDDHMPDVVRAHRGVTTIGLGVAGTVGAGLLAYFGHPIVGATVGSFVAGVGAFEGLSALAESKSSDDEDTKPAVGPNQPGMMLPTIGPVSPQQAIAAGQDAVNQAINVLAPWLNPPQPGGVPGTTDPNGQPVGPNIPYLPNGYQDPFGAAVGILNTLGQHAAPPPGAPANGGGYVPSPWGPIPVGPNGLPGDVLPPSQWPPPVQRVVRVGCVAPINRVIAMPYA